MPHYHFPADALTEVALTGFGVTEDGDDAVRLTGDIVVTTDNVLILASVFQGLANGILSCYAEVHGADVLVDRVAQLNAELNGEAEPAFPEPEPEQQAIRFASAPDIAGRDI